MSLAISLVVVCQEMYPVQINLHSKFNVPHAFESFRAAQLLTNGVCLLSEPSHKLDWLVHKAHHPQCSTYVLRWRVFKSLPPKTNMAKEGIDVRFH
eukprot:1811370-Amphidinium_carterae.1